MFDNHDGFNLTSGLPLKNIKYLTYHYFKTDRERLELMAIAQRHNSIEIKVRKNHIQVYFWHYEESKAFSNEAWNLQG